MSERNDIINCPVASSWIKNQLAQSANRDPIDLINDLIVLKRVLETEYLARLKRQDLNILDDIVLSFS